MNNKTCGTCLNYRQTEVSFYEGDKHPVMVEHCAINPDRLCGYCYLACENYDPDQDYIDFVFGKATDA